MLRINSKDLRNCNFGCSAATTKEVADLIFVQAELRSKATQRPVAHPQFRFDLFRVQGH